MTFEGGCDLVLLLVARGRMSGSTVFVEPAWCGGVSSLDPLPSLFPPAAWSDPELKVSVCEVT